MNVLRRCQPGALLLVALLAGCGPSLDRLQIDPTPRPARAVSEVQVLLDEPTQPYRSIALIEATTVGSADLSLLADRLKEEAARLGGDAVLVSGRAGKSGLLGRVIVFTR
jgi:hypothetical protein